MTDLRTIKNIDLRAIRYIGEQTIAPGATAVIDIDNRAVRHDLRRHVGKYVFDDSSAAGLAVVVQKYVYDFDELGGAEGVITLTAPDGSPQEIPVGAMFISSSYPVTLEGVENIVGEASSLKIGFTDDDDCIGGGLQVLEGSYQFADPGTTSGSAVSGATGYTVVTAPQSVIMTVVDSPITAGKFNVWIQYLPGGGSE